MLISSRTVLASGVVAILAGCASPPEGGFDRRAAMAQCEQRRAAAPGSPGPVDDCAQLVAQQANEAALLGGVDGSGGGSATGSGGGRTRPEGGAHGGGSFGMGAGGMGTGFGRGGGFGGAPDAVPGGNDVPPTSCSFGGASSGTCQ